MTENDASRVNIGDESDLMAVGRLPTPPTPPPPPAPVIIHVPIPSPPPPDTSTVAPLLDECHSPSLVFAPLSSTSSIEKIEMVPLNPSRWARFTPSPLSPGAMQALTIISILLVPLFTKGTTPPPVMPLPPPASITVCEFSPPGRSWLGLLMRIVLWLLSMMPATSNLWFEGDKNKLKWAIFVAGIGSGLALISLG